MKSTFEPAAFSGLTTEINNSPIALSPTAFRHGAIAQQPSKDEMNAVNNPLSQAAKPPAIPVVLAA
jgi:hypothetical protein